MALDFLDVAGDVGGLFSQLLNPFGLPSKGQWNLQQGKFITSDGTVVFFIETRIGQFPGQFTAIDTINDTGGRRLATYEYPYVDGHAVADLGRKGEKFSMNIKFFGDNYQGLFKDFIDTVTKSNKKGTLIHPVRGAFPARFLDWDFLHRHDEWNAVTIKANWIEDNSGTIFSLNLASLFPNAILRNALSVLAQINSALQQAIATVSALLDLPAALTKAFKDALDAIVSNYTKLLAKLSSTYSTDAQTQTLLASSASTGNVLNVNSGTSSGTPSVPSAQLPPVFQVGLSPSDLTAATNNLNNFVTSNQITPQQGLYDANQVRQLIADAIAALEASLGNQAYQLVLQYRMLAVQVQQVTQGCIATAQSQIKLYLVPSPMSLRMVAFNNNLDTDRQNDIEALNPFLGSVNYIPAGTQLVVPAS